MNKVLELFGKRRIEDHRIYKALDASFKKCSAERHAAFALARKYQGSLRRIQTKIQSITGNEIDCGSVEDDLTNNPSEDVRWHYRLEEEAENALEKYDLLQREFAQLEREFRDKEKRIHELESNYQDRIDEANRARRELHDAEGEMLSKVYLEKLLAETTKRLKEAGTTYHSAWDAGKQTFPALLQALREYAENHYENDIINDFEDMKALSYASEEATRIAQYDIIIRLYNDKIAKARAEAIDEEDKEDTIQALRQFRDVEIEELSRASNA